MIRVSIAVVVASVLLWPIAARAQAEEESKDESAKAAPPDEEEPPAEGPKKKKKKKKVEDEAPVTATATVSSGDLVESGAPKGRMTLPGGSFMLSAIVDTNLAKKAAGKPLSIAPDLWIGLADRLTVGIYHSRRATTGLLSGFGTGLCLRDDTCKVGLGDIYTFAGAEARIGLTEGGFASALVVGGNATFVDPDKFFKAKGGFLTRINGKRLAVELSPVIFVGLNKRKGTGMGTGSQNPDVVVVPLTIFLRFAPRVAFAVQGGATFNTKKAGDTYKISAAAGLSVWLTPHFAFDAAFGLAAVKDKDPMTKAFDQRSATVGLSYAL